MGGAAAARAKTAPVRKRAPAGAAHTSQSPNAAATTMRLVRARTASANNAPIAATPKSRSPRARQSQRAVINKAVAGNSDKTAPSLETAVTATSMSAARPAEAGSVKRRAIAKTAMLDARIQAVPKRRTTGIDSPNAAIAPASMK